MAPPPRHWLAVGLWVLCAQPLTGQNRVDPASLDLVPDQRVRVESDRLVHHAAEGRLATWDAGGVQIDEGSGDPLSLAWSDIHRLRVVRSTRGAWWEGGFIGLLVGLAVAEGIVGNDRDDGQIDPSCGEAHCYDPGFWVAMGAAGAGVGAATGGLLFSRTLWRDVPLPGGPAAATGDVSWAREGARLRLRLVR